MAADPNAHAVIQGDMDTLLKWFGVESLDKWHALSLDEQRPFHEKFAEGFETYLFEGKAPSVELRGIFGRFASWLKQVYKSVSGLAPINDEIRGVMDRMLASEDQIHQAEKARGYEALFRSAEEAAKFGMGPEAWQEYSKANAEATSEAIDYLQKRSLADMQWLSNAKSKALKALQREAKDKRTEIADAVMHEVSALPEYQARDYLKANKIKLDADGNYPDDIADRFGFSSGAEMTAKLRDTEPLKERVRAMTDLQMLERHGELVDPQAIERAAEAAIHNDMRARVMATELSALTRAMGNVSALMRGARDAATAAIGAKRILDIRPTSYTTSEARAQREADNAMRKLQDPDTAYRSAFTREKNARLEEGRTPEEADAFAAQKGEEARAKAQDKVDANGGRTPPEIAAQAKRAALLNNRLARAAGDALDEVNKGVAYFRRMQSAGAQKNMRGDALEQLSALLGRFDLRTSRARSDIEANRMPLKDWVVQEADRLTAIAPDLPAFVLNENYRKHYKEMTVDEFRALVDSVKQLEFMARREQSQYLAIRNQSFQQEREALLGVLRGNYPKLFEADGTPKGMPEHFAPTIGRGLSKLGDKFLGEFLSPENIVSVLERGELGGVHESLIQRISHREEWKAERLGGIFKKMEPLFKAYSLKERLEFGRKGYYIKEIDNTITRENAVMVALLYGNKEGRERLLNYGWNERQAQAIMHILDGRDLDLVKGAWDLFDNDLWPELKALNERTRGKAPPKVEATPYNVNGVDMPGGYMRLKYDTTLDERIYRLEEGAAVKEMLGGTASGYGAKTNQGASNERQQGVKLRPRLDLNVMAEAINETVHDVAFREALADTMRMLNDKGVTSALKQAAGEAGYRALVNKVRHVAAMQRDPSGFIEKSLTVARRNTVVNLMSGVKTALQNFTGIASSFTRVDTGLLAGEIAKFYSPDMVERVRFAMDQSAYMRQRFTSYDRDLQIAMKKLTVNGKIMPDTASFLWMMGMVDRGVAVPTWNAAFKEGMGKFANDRDKAVEWADHIVRQTQGSGREIDLPQLMSGRGPLGELKKVFTMFHSYFNGQLGLLVVNGAIAKHQAQTNPYAATAEFTAKMLLMTAVPAVLTQFLMHGSESDDGDPKKWAKIISLYGTQMFPLVRDAASFVTARTDPDSKHHNTSFRLSPIESLAESVLYKLPVALSDMARNGGNDKDLKDAIMGMGFLFGLPGKLVADTTLGTKAWTEGKAGPEAAVLGPPKN